MFTEKSANLILSQFHRKNGRLNGRYRGGLKIYCSSGTQMKPNVVSRFPQFLANLQVGSCCYCSSVHLTSLTFYIAQVITRKLQNRKTTLKRYRKVNCKANKFTNIKLLNHLLTRFVYTAQLLYLKSDPLHNLMSQLESTFFSKAFWLSLYVTKSF